MTGRSAPEASWSGWPVACRVRTAPEPPCDAEVSTSFTVTARVAVGRTQGSYATRAERDAAFIKKPRDQGAGRKLGRTG
jgi:hypothetical protein